MARRMPPSSPASSIIISQWQVAAAITIIISLCSSCHRNSSSKSRSPPSPPRPPNESISKQEEEQDTAPTSTGQVLEHQEGTERTTEEEVTMIDVATHGPILPTPPPALSSSRRKLSISLSNRLPEKMRTSRKEQKDKEKATTSEETLWKKTIILGEKCRVPSGEKKEEEEEEGTNRTTNYHPRTPRSRPASRTNSFAYSDGVQS